MPTNNTNATNTTHTADFPSAPPEAPHRAVVMEGHVLAFYAWLDVLDALDWNACCAQQKRAEGAWLNGVEGEFYRGT